jgi:hypothetical protein
MFRVISIVQNYIHHFADRSCLIGSAINVVHWNGMVESLSCEFIPMYIIIIYKKASGSGINEGTDSFGFLNVHGGDLNLDIQGVSRQSGSNHILV